MNKQELEKMREECKERTICKQHTNTTYICPYYGELCGVAKQLPQDFTDSDIRALAEDKPIPHVR